MLAVVEKAAPPKVTLSPPAGITDDYVLPQKGFDFDTAFARARSEKGHWFKTESGDIFALFIGTSAAKEGAPEQVSASLYILMDKGPDKGLLRLAAFLDTKHLSNGEGPKATCFEPIPGTGQGNEFIAAADRARDAVKGVGYWTDNDLSKTRGTGPYEGLGRFLLMVQGVHAQKQGRLKFVMYTPTARELKVLVDFYNERGQEELVVSKPLEDAGGHLQLNVDLLKVDFSRKQAEIRTGGFNVERKLPPTTKEGQEASFTPIPFKEFILDDVTIGRAHSKDGCRVRMPSDEVFAIFIRENGLDLDAEANQKLKADCTKFTQVTVSIFHLDKEKLVPAAFCDRRLITGKDGVMRAETKGYPIIGSDPENKCLADMDEALRATAPKDPVFNVPLAYGTADAYSKHKGGKFSGVGRFALTIQEMLSQRAGAVKSELYVTKVRKEDITMATKDGVKEGALDWVTRIYGDAAVSHSEDLEQGILRADLRECKFKLDEIVSVYPKLEDVLQGMNAK